MPRNYVNGWMRAMDKFMGRPKGQKAAATELGEEGSGDEEAFGMPPEDSEKAGAVVPTKWGAANDRMDYVQFHEMKVSHVHGLM